jgi:hypothetical protein
MLFTVNGGQLYIETTVSAGMPILMAFLDAARAESDSSPSEPAKAKRSGGGRPKGSKNRKSLAVKDEVQKGIIGDNAQLDPVPEEVAA